MVTLSEAYKMVKPHISNVFEIEACLEYEDYYVFPTRWRDGRPDYRAGGGSLGVQKSTGKLSCIAFCTENFCDWAWDYETGKMVSDDIGKPIKEYGIEEIKNMSIL